MDVTSPLPPLFDDQLLDEGQDGEEEDEDDETFAPLLGDNEDDEEDAVLPLTQASRPEQGDFRFIEVCRRAAAKLKIDWPVPQNDAGATRHFRWQTSALSSPASETTSSRRSGVRRRYEAFLGQTLFPSGACQRFFHRGCPGDGRAWAIRPTDSRAIRPQASAPEPENLPLCG